MPELSLDELAATLDTTPERLGMVIQQTVERVPYRRYYVFRITSGQRSTASASDTPRLIAAFPSPDAALAFAQRNGYGSNAQLRPIATADLVLRLLSEPSIGAVLFLEEPASEQTKGFGPGIKLQRSDLLSALQAGTEVSSPIAPASATLSAEQYDALQFGINFTGRAEFRVALAQAIEQVVASYEPPPGSVDRGPRSIFATTAVEAWLREHGFPRAHQRRWIDVSDEPEWGGAVELCEIDAGTVNRLLIQLAIHEDETGRQFIKWVNVTV